MIWRGIAYPDTDASGRQKAAPGKNMTWRGTTYSPIRGIEEKQSDRSNRMDVDLRKWFLTAYEAYQQNQSTLPKPPFRLDGGLEVVDGKFYLSIQRIVKQKRELPQTTQQALQSLFNYSLSR